MSNFKYPKGNRIMITNARLKNYNSKFYIECNQKSGISLIKEDPGLHKKAPDAQVEYSEIQIDDLIENSKTHSKFKDLSKTCDQIDVKATIADVKYDLQAYFPACDICSGKLMAYGLEWRCDCGFATQRPNYKFSFKLLLDDGESKFQMQIFEPAALKLMKGVTANELLGLGNYEEMKNAIR
eukprot:CAMPEP_0176443584 /NCGR_PEP_ID=MMETSP0127-20121128/22522_1 /TAXON_ID=938130 /ORGANISM="Platyophrya macrostoma, Strain WH" /LENGTH=181 /DNA_ID=CAMNT_0017828865 /DNA_START=84 /DNA_END=626 /DNA_ORIENTATION=-